jgi:hypothetical protein
MTDEHSRFPLVESMASDSVEGAAVVFRVAFTKEQLEAFAFGFAPEEAFREYILALVSGTGDEEEVWHPKI